MNEEKMNILTVEPLAASPWLGLFHVTYTLDGSSTRSWTLASRQKTPRCASGRFERPDAVIIAAYHTGRSRLVITREYRVPLAGYEVGLPAGLVDPGENVADTVHRELREETGLEVVRILSQSPPLFSSAGMTDESFSLVSVECEGETSQAEAHDGEVIQVEFVSPEEASRLCADPELKFDAKAWLVMRHYAATGRLI
jgi:ADP-ribose pyrophosphatase